MKYLKLYGLQRSGTNYLKWILEQNFDVFILQNFRGWKHGEVLFLSKNEDYNRDLSVCTLNEEQKKLIKESDIPRLAIKKNIYAWLVDFNKYQYFCWGAEYKKWIDHYFKLNANYEQHCHMIEYEKLLAYPGDHLKEFKKLYSLDMRHPEFVLYAVFKPEYYFNKEYMNEIPNLLEINAYLESIQKK